MNLVPETLHYIVSAPNFWLGVGFLFATAMFIGALIHNGELHSVQRGVVTLAVYMFFIVWMTLERVLGAIADGTGESSAKAYAGVVTFSVVGIIYALGLVWGVIIVALIKRHDKKNE